MWTAPFTDLDQPQFDHLWVIRSNNTDDNLLRIQTLPLKFCCMQHKVLFFRLIIPLPRVSRVGFSSAFLLCPIVPWETLCETACFVRI